MTHRGLRLSDCTLTECRSNGWVYDVARPVENVNFVDIIPGSISVSTRACHHGRTRESGVRLPARELKNLLVAFYQAFGFMAFGL